MALATVFPLLSAGVGLGTVELFARSPEALSLCSCMEKHIYLGVDVVTVLMVISIVRGEALRKHHKRQGGHYGGYVRYRKRLSLLPRIAGNTGIFELPRVSCGVPASMRKTGTSWQRKSVNPWTGEPNAIDSAKTIYSTFY